MIRKIERDTAGVMTAGQELVIAGYAGYGGTAVIADRKKDELQKHFSKEWICGLELWKDELAVLADRDLAFFEKLGATECEPAGEGGILAALWNLFGAYQLGFELTLRRIPILQETVEICECFELNPYRLYSKGCYILTAEHGFALAEALNREGIPAVVAGHVTKGAKKVIFQGEGQSYLDRPTEDELSKVAGAAFFNK